MRVVTIGFSYCASKTGTRTYERSLQQAGETIGVAIEPIWLAGDETGLDRAALARIDGLVLTGGVDVDPARYDRADLAPLCEVNERRDRIEWELLDAIGARAPRVPILAICRGMQILNAYRGGTLIADLQTGLHHRSPGCDVYERHAVRLEPASTLGKRCGERGDVNSWHHQAVDRLADDFVPIAWAPDGTLEAYELRDINAHPYLLGVQWHPEGMEPTAPLAAAPLQGFLTAISAVNLAL
jgi:putative glutamine amidotransferase